MRSGPPAQRGDPRLPGVAGHRAEPGQQHDQPGDRGSGFEIVVPVSRVRRLPGRLVVPVAQLAQRSVHRLPETGFARHFILAKHHEQGHHQQPHAVLVLRVRLRRAHCAQAGQPSGDQVRIVWRPALQRGTAGHPPAAELQQARRDRDAPRPVQRPDVSHRPQLRRHVHAERRACRGHVGLAQHLAGCHRSPARPDPAAQGDGPTHDNAFAREPRGVAKLAPRSRYVHIATLLPPGLSRAWHRLVRAIRPAASLPGTAAVSL